MFATLRNKILKWSHGNHIEKNQNNRSYFLRAFIKISEDVLLWRKTHLSLAFVLLLNIFFIVCIHHNVQLHELLITVSLVVITLDAFEMWLKNKHRTNFLQNLVSSDGDKLHQGIYLLQKWSIQKLNDYISLRETNHTKAFLCLSIIFGAVFIIGKSINGYTLAYIIFMLITWFRVLAPLAIRLFKKFQQTAISDESDIDSLIPEASEQDMKELNFELEYVPDEKHSLDYWKPEEPLDDISDSSETSTSIVTNLSMEHTHTLEQEIDISSSSSEDDYLPKVHKEEQMQSTLEVIHPGDTLSSTAMSAFWKLTSTMASLVNASAPAPTPHRRKRMSSVDSSDGFEIVDRNDVI